MTLREGIELFKDHQKNSVRSKTRKSYEHTLRNLEGLLGDHLLEAVSSQDLYQFLILLTEGRAKSTARLRYAQLKAFYNFTIERTHLTTLNPCNDSLLSKTFRAPRMRQRENAECIVMRRKGSRERRQGNEFNGLELSSGGDYSA